ncbi:hypothetical protein HXK64_01885 [Candidatus Gracilibacteria bacterium]|nr:hypothetical protein [Candidatus Gracilibacteria bacterium]
MNPENTWSKLKYEDNSNKELNSQKLEKNDLNNKNNNVLPNLAWDEGNNKEANKFLEQYPQIREETDGINDSGDIEFESLEYQSIQERTNFKNNDIHKTLPNANGITVRENGFFSNDGIANIGESTKLDNLIYAGQRLSIQEKGGERRNVGRGIDINSKGEYTYVYLDTKEPVVLNNGAQILQFDESNMYNINQNEKTEGFKGPILSERATKSARGVTECSKTARLNLEKLGCPSPIKRGNAKDAFNQYSQTPDKIFPPKDESAKLMDLYFDASPKFRQYGHRAVGVKISGEWHVLDPYYTKTRNPVPANQYMSLMSSLGRGFWGGFSVG